MVGEIISEWRAVSSRNRGRLAEDMLVAGNLAQLEQLGGTFYDFTISDASQIKGLDRARA